MVRIVGGTGAGGVKIEGQERLRRKLRSLPNDLAEPIKIVITKSAIDIENEMKALVNTPGTGRLYTTRFRTIGTGATRKVIPYGTRPPHRASAPDKPPAPDTKALGASIDTTHLDQGFAAEIGTGIEYARYLEFGTDRNAPRPFLRPAYAKHEKRIVNNITNVVRQALKKSGRR